MVKVQEMTKVADNSYKISAFADTKEEVASAQFVGLPFDANIEMGSTVLTASGDIAFRKSDGTWNWLEEG